VSRVLPRDEVLPRRRQGKLAAPDVALAWTKRLLRAAEHGSLADQMELEAQLQASAVLTRDHAEGVAAFLEKREPRFEGR
jgi:2-(1,2-epoxy-1,2-dihydrophenyl)acetyl-CoA isomerase